MNNSIQSTTATMSAPGVGDAVETRRPVTR